jgi:predicted metal-binding membrane protein
MTLAFGGLRVTTVRQRAREGRPVHSPWRYVVSSPLVWAGLGLIAIAANKIAGDIAITVWMVAVVWMFGRIALHGITGLSRAPKAVRRIGDPRAWRGESSSDERSPGA